MPRHPSVSVMAIAALKTLDGLWGLASGCALLSGGGALAAMIDRVAGDAPHWIGNALGGVLALVGLALILFAALDFILAWGVWTLRRWAWWLTMISAVLSSLGSLATLVAGNLTSLPSGVAATRHQWHHPHPAAYAKCEADIRMTIRPGGYSGKNA